MTQCHNKKGLNNNVQNEVAESGNTVEYSKQNLTATEFVKWCGDKENNLSKTKQISELNYHLKYLPKEAMAMLELRTEKYDYKKFQEVGSHYTDMTYFNLKIEVPETSGELLKYQIQSPQQYEKRVKYMSFDMQNDIYLVQGIDTLTAGLYQVERIFEVAPYSTSMIAFDNKKFNKEKEFTIVFNDRLFEKGFIKFNYKNGQLINLPNITGL